MTKGTDEDLDVSVVVSTYQRAGLVDDLVDSLLATDSDLAHEFVVVDNGSTDGTAELLRRRVAGDDTGRLRVLRIEDNRGPARARNVGWRSARGRVVAFTDDDCVVAPDWLDRLARPLLDGRADVVQGRTEPRQDQAHRNVEWSRTQHIPALTGLYETCNIAYRRSVLETLGGFIEDFPIAAGEDTDLGLRARACGARIAFADDARAFHEVWQQTFVQALADRGRVAQLPLLLRTCPQLRERMTLGLFWRPGHAVTIGALAATAGAAAVRPRHGITALAIWVAARSVRIRRPLPPLRRVRLAAEQVVGDSWEVTATVAGSIRHRSLML